MLDLSEIAPRLTEVERGLWAAGEQEAVSYPVDGHRMLVGFEEDSFWFAHRADVVRELLARYPAPGCILDVGGGTGYMVQAIRNTGAEAILVEPGEDGARAALLRGLRPVVNATPATAGFLHGTIAAVSLFDVLEHIEDDVGFLRHIHDLLMPQGRLYMTVPAYSWLWSVDDERAGHFRRYTARSLRTVLSRSQFDLEFNSYFFTMLPPAIMVARTIPSLIGLRSVEGSRAGEHHKPGGIGSAFDFALRTELTYMRLHRIPFGGSLVAVARKRRVRS